LGITRRRRASVGPQQPVERLTKAGECSGSNYSSGDYSLISGGAVHRIKETFIGIPRQWCMIEIDSLAWDVLSYAQAAEMSLSLIHPGSQKPDDG